MAHTVGSRDKSILIGAKVEIMTKLGSAAQPPSLPLSFSFLFFPTLFYSSIYTDVYIYIYVVCNTTTTARKERRW